VATQYAKYNRRLSYIVATIGVITGSGLVATLSNQNKALQLALAIASLVAAAIVAYQRSAEFASESAHHQRSGAEWGVIVDETESLRQEVKSTTDPRDADFDQLRKQMEAVTARSPQIPARYFTKHKVDQTYMYADGERFSADES
jgi:hypothetical protein